MPKIARLMPITMPIPPLGKRSAIGIPMSTNTRLATAMENFFWISSWYSRIWPSIFSSRASV